MSCSLPDDLPWSPLLTARDLLAQGAAGLAFVRRSGRWTCEPAQSLEPAGVAPAGIEAALLVGDAAQLRDRLIAAQCPTTRYRTGALGLPEFEHLHGPPLEAGMAMAARVYLPILLGAAKAQRDGRSFVAGHVTQTLDGRIACENGQSQWIGNDADQRHAHRMRALLDGVLVGATTALRDDPRLTVRHVEGSDPRRIVLSGRGRVLREGAHLGLLRAPGCEVLVGEGNEAAPVHDSVCVHTVPAAHGRMDAELALRALRGRGIHSVYLEGGSGALSSFLQAGHVDVLQVHVAAMLLGSGLPSLQLPPAEHVRDGIRLHMDHVVLDGHVLLTCVPADAPAV